MSTVETLKAWADKLRKKHGDQELLEAIDEALTWHKVGHWIINSDGYYPMCSNCGDEPQWTTDYCPKCGAKMITGWTGGEDEE
jgi:hypothetical protein